MIHWKTGFYAYLYCKKCHRKTKHLHWKDEVVYSTKDGWFTIGETKTGLSNGYECTICHNHFNFDGRVKLWKAYRKRRKK